MNKRIDKEYGISKICRIHNSIVLFKMTVDSLKILELSLRPFYIKLSNGELINMFQCQKDTSFINNA